MAGSVRGSLPSLPRAFRKEIIFKKEGRSLAQSKLYLTFALASAEKSGTGVPAGRSAHLSKGIARYWEVWVSGLNQQFAKLPCE